MTGYRRGVPYVITCVCLGNICRSPMAEAILRKAFDEAGLSADVVVDSAGTGGWHEGDDADPRALATVSYTHLGLWGPSPGRCA